MRRVAYRFGDAALWFVAIIGCCCLILIFAGLALGTHPLIFRSGSMSPTITAGSLGVAREVPADKIAIGDIVSVPAQGSRVTHRVVSAHLTDGVTELHLKGDANHQPDEQTYRVEEVDRLWFAVPGLGYVVAWLSRPPGVFVLALYAAVMIAILIRRPGPRSEDGDRSGDDSSTGPEEVDHDRRAAGPPARRVADVRAARRATGRIARRAPVAAFGVVLIGITTVMARPSWAAFTDPAPISGATLSAYTIPATTLSCGTLAVGAVTFTWTAVPNATNYTLHYGSGGVQTAIVSGTSRRVTGVIASGTAWVEVNRSFGTGSTTWTSAQSNRRTYSITAAVIALCS
ncbi:signal peptidase I [Microlunatus elymi]|uniref:Signal peptidase I n=1 Tax=Microlunatus elymi TaxID=2596828 RepID=A0A516PU78_9ACTN|nr:signal peptidase I [Microlunatus elymi]QDP94521.1 signal peptidase I [Microlunatus elymi]